MYGALSSVIWRRVVQWKYKFSDVSDEHTTVNNKNMAELQTYNLLVAQVPFSLWSRNHSMW
jgi:hypothetical protein